MVPEVRCELRRRRPRPGDKWHMDEVFIRVRGELHYLWRAVDQDGIVLDILVQRRRDAEAAKCFFKRLLKGLQYVPRVIVTDKLGSYGVAKRALMPGVEHRKSRYLNNRAENSHRPTRRRERQMQRFKSPRQSAPLPVGTRLHLWPLSSTTPSDDREQVSGSSFSGLQGLEPGNVCSDGSMNASCSALIPKIRLQLVKLTMPHRSRKANRREFTQCGNPPPGNSRNLADLPLVERAFGANYDTVLVVDPDGYRTETYCARAA
jgi:hypothetical protein